MGKDTVLITGFTPFIELGPEEDRSFAPNISGEMAKIIDGSVEIQRSIAETCRASAVAVRIVDVNGPWQGRSGFSAMLREVRDKGHNLTGMFGLGAGYNGMREGSPLYVLHEGILVEGMARNEFQAPRMGVDEARQINMKYPLDEHILHRHYDKLAVAVEKTGNLKIKFHAEGMDEVGAGTDMCNFTLWQINSSLSRFGSGVRMGGFVHANCMMSEEWRDDLIGTPDAANRLRRSMNEPRKEGNPPLDIDEIDRFIAMSAILSPEEAVDLFQTFLREYARKLSFFQTE